jgi:hypothetical protein
MSRFTTRAEFEVKRVGKRRYVCSTHLRADEEGNTTESVLSRIATRKSVEEQEREAAKLSEAV